MSNIQQSINATLNQVSLLKAINPKTAIKEQGKKIYKEAEAASQGINDIYENARKGKFKNYSQTQLADISNRITEHNKKINDLRTAELNPELSKYLGIKGGVGSGSEYVSKLKTIEQAIYDASPQNKAKDIAIYNSSSEIEAKKRQRNEIENRLGGQ